MPPRNSEPNIFSYAKKELSQDAMICWLVACVHHEDPVLRLCGEAFVRTLFRAGSGARAKKVRVLDPKTDQYAWHLGTGQDISLLEAPSTQYKDIDVYFRARVDNKIVSFIIEDKTESKPHDNQLTRYRQAVTRDKIREDWIKPVYFKTGYVFEEEERYVEARRYSLYTLPTLVQFLRTQITAIRKSDLLTQYWAYVRGKLEQRERTLARSLGVEAEYEGTESLDQRQTEAARNRSTPKFLNDGVAQYEFMLRLRQQLIAEADWVELLDAKLAWDSPKPSASYGLTPYCWSRKPVQKHAWLEILHGISRGGSPWSQLYFCKQFFWRIDSGRPLRLMLNGDGVDRQLWERCCHRFNEAVASCRMQSGDVRFRFGNECTIGAVQLDHSTQTPLRVIEQLPTLQTEFLRRILS